MNCETGVWSDFATGEGGSDPVSLFAAINGVGQAEAARALGDELRVAQSGRPVPPRPKKPTWTPILPVPADAPAPDFVHMRLGRPTTTWCYRDQAGTVLGYVCRFDSAGSRKEILPRTYCLDEAGRTRWTWKQFPTPRPLYGLDALAARPEAPVLVVEGEKATDAARAISGGLVVVSWPGGSSAVSRADWLPLRGRRVALWPDNDKPGFNAMLAIADLADSVGFTLAGIVLPDAAWPEGADIADFPAWTQEDLATEIKTRLMSVDAFRAAVVGEGQELPAEQEPIQIRDGGLPELVDACESLLLQADLPVKARVFQRGGQLVRVAVLPAPSISSGVSRPTGAAMIVPVERVFLQDLLGRIGRFTRFDRRRKAWVQTDVPKAAAEALLARRGMWKLPLLRGVISCPTLRPDGSLMVDPGYDTATGYFLADGLQVSVPEKPTQDDAWKALETLRRLLAGFAFVDEADEAVALALIVTAIVRPALDTTPIFNVTAPVRGSGKSTLVDIAAALATGRRAAVLSATKDPGELEKRLVGCLLSGDGLVSLDNINGQLASDLLCQASTAEAVKLRPLGASLQVEVENTTLWTANGNNLTLAGDLARRALLCRLDPAMERPEERTFDFDPVSRAREYRSRYVACALTILRAYLANGQQDMALVPFGSFDRWSALVRQALVWTGTADPCASRGELLEDDPELARLRAVLVPWFDKFGRTPRNVRELVKAAQEEDDADLGAALEEVAGDGRGNVNSRKLGFWLRRNMGRIAGGYKLQRFGEKQNSAEWQVVAA
ncbi:MAG: hypothetical protein AB7D39_20765 [Pseudodesulfovibrio sp.]|uniref:toprim domain-containing protein n=1 Tax=Pseudodesulfovibrio sp. TaxID=2035812 RepID=UPI003D11ACA5